MFGKGSRSLLILLLAVMLLAVGSVAERSVREVGVSGTGFLVEESGYVLTNEHVIHAATDIKVAVGGEEYSAQAAGVQSEQDLALLRFSASGLPTIALGDSDKVQIGDEVVAIGCPEGHCGTVTVGRVANLHQTATFEDRTLHNLIMIDVTITHGSSGGPLLNMKGEVIGITMGGIEGTRFGFAIPINDAISLLERVPGFSRSQMGQATEELALSEVIERASPAVSYVETSSTIPLEAFLLAKEEFIQALGRDVELGEPRTGYSLFSDCSNRAYLRRQVEEYVEVTAWGIFDVFGQRQLLPLHVMQVLDLTTADAADDIRACLVWVFKGQQPTYNQYEFIGCTDAAGNHARCARIYLFREEIRRTLGISVYVAFIIERKWDCSQYCTWQCHDPLHPVPPCEPCDYAACVQNPPNWTYGQGFVAWLVGDLLFTIEQEMPGSPYEDQVAEITALAQAGISHAIEVLQNPPG